MIKQLKHFSSIGILSTLIHVLVALLVESTFALSGLGANALGFCTALLFSYFGHARFTFGISLNHAFHFPRFLATALLAFAFSSFIVWFVHDQSAAPFWLAMAIVAVAVPSITFVTLKYWVFGNCGVLGILEMPFPLLLTICVALAHFFFVAIWYHLPLVDLPNHIARFYIATDPDLALHEFYRYTFAFKANSAVDAIWLAVGQHLTDPIRFASLMMALYAFNLIMSVAVLARVIHGKWLIWPLAASIAVFNANFFFGFQNFLFSVPFSIYGLAIWIAMSKLSPTRRALYFIAPAYAVFQMHLIAFSIMPLAILGIELEKVWQAKGQRLSHFLNNSIAAVPFLLPLFYYAISRSLGPPSPYGTETIMGPAWRRVETFFSPTGISSASSISQVQVSSAILLLALLLIMASVFARKNARLEVAANMRGALIVMLIASIVVPMEVGGVALAHLRYPFVFVVLFLAMTQWVELMRRQIVLFSLLLLSLFVWRSALVFAYFHEYSSDMADLRAVLEELEPGDRLLPLRAGTAELNRRSNHIQAYAVVYSNAFVPTLFQGTHGLSVTENWRDNATPAWSALSAEYIFQNEYWHPEQFSPRKFAYWNNWQEKFTHILAMGKISESIMMRYELDCVKSVGRFRLYLTPAGQVGLNESLKENCTDLEE